MQQGCITRLLCSKCILVLQIHIAMAKFYHIDGTVEKKAITVYSLFF